MPVWHSGLKDNAADTTVTTYVGAAGTSARNTSVISTTGRIGLGFDLYNGSVDDAIVLPNCDTWGGAKPWSFCIWIKPDSAGESSGGRILDCNAGAFGSVWDCGGSGTNVCFNSGSLLVSTGTWTVSQWNHICVTHTAAGAGTIYINGKYDTAGASGVTSVASSARIGNNAAADRAFDGIVDDVRIYSQVLTADQVAWIYNAGQGREDNVN